MSDNFTLTWWDLPNEVACRHLAEMLNELDNGDYVLTLIRKEDYTQASVRKDIEQVEQVEANA